MSPIIILVVILCYFLLLFGVSFIAGRKADNAGFFSGNKSSNWVLVAMSTIGAAISGVTFVSVPGMVEGAAFSYMQMVLGFTVGQIIVAYVLIPMYYKRNLTSIYEYLNQRFGVCSYKTGAWFFFVSKMLGASVRLFVVGSALQLLVFGPLNLPFWLNAIFTVLIVYLCTFKGGVKSLIWTDLLKTCCLILSVVLCIVFVMKAGVGFDGFGDSEMTKTFFFDDAKDGKFFWKQFLAGVFLVIATTGLDQDMMQRTLSCKNYKESQKNMIVGAVMQIFIIFLFLVLGYLLYTYATKEGVDLGHLKGDDVFPFLATGNHFPVIVGILFIVGFIAAAYSAAGSALTALTTSFTIDILNKKEAKTGKVRHLVHIGMAVLMAVCIFVVYLLNNDSVIQTVYKVAAYTYGPLLGLFMFGMMTKFEVRDKWLPLVCILSPVLCLILNINSEKWFNGYQFSHEILIFNALFTFMGMLLLVKGKKHIAMKAIVAALFIALFGFMGYKAYATSHIKTPVSLTWELVQNEIEPNVVETKITITNNMKEPLSQGWELHYCQMSVMPINYDTAEVNIESKCASYHIMRPTEHFSPISSGESKTLVLHHRGSVIRKTGGPQGPFLVIDGKPQTVDITYKYSNDGHEFYRNAGYPYADGEEVYKQNARFKETKSSKVLELLPQPKNVVFTDGTCDYKKAVIVEKTDETLPEQGYQLFIHNDTIFSISSGEIGTIYAKVTLQQLAENYQNTIPCCEILDYPDILHRGIMIDIARNYTKKEELMKLIPVLGSLKVNYIHLHLCDDEAWRLEIPGLPELTEIGSRRGYTTDEHDCLFPSYNGGWDMNDKNSTSNGYLTREDYIDLLKECKKYGIFVMPEVDMPGHSRAAMRCMEARYDKYKDTDMAKATEYLLTDLNDTSVYSSAQYYTDDVICIAMPSAYTFTFKIIDEIEKMHAEAGNPLLIFNVGGDEVAKGAWLGSPLAQAFIAEHNMEGTADLKDYFLQRIVDYLDAKGIQTAGWEEIAMRGGKANPRFGGKNVLSLCWNCIPEWKGDEKPYTLANAEYPVIISGVGTQYLDMCYTNHEEELGLHWGGYTDEYTTFDMQPFDIYKSVRRTMRGLPRDVEAYNETDKTRLEADKTKYIQGIQVHLFAETVRSAAQVQRHIFPKIFGMAERGWNAHALSGVDYMQALNEYNTYLYTYALPTLVKQSVHFHLGLPGIHKENGKIYMNHPISSENLKVYYTTDGTEPTQKSALYTAPFESDATLIKAKAFYLGEESVTTKLRLVKQTEIEDIQLQQTTF